MILWIFIGFHKGLHRIPKGGPFALMHAICSLYYLIGEGPSEFSFDTAREEPCQLGTAPAGLSGTAPSVLSAHALPSLAPLTAQVTPCSEACLHFTLNCESITAARAVDREFLM